MQTHAPDTHTRRPPLSVKHAEIRTAAVEIKTLTVTGKQVTLAVFRQLREKPLINHDGSLAGIPWGTVNYHPDKCQDAPLHWHVVWQEGAELRRSLIFESPEFDLFKSNYGDGLLMAYYEGVLDGEIDIGDNPFFNYVFPKDMIEPRTHSMHTSLNLPGRHQCTFHGIVVSFPSTPYTSTSRRLSRVR